jgi:uncharacterized protein
MKTNFPKSLLCCILSLTVLLNLNAQSASPLFKVVGFFTARSDQAHISFVHEANKWLAKVAAENHFSYDSTNNWSNMNASYLSQYQVVLFLDTRPDSPAHRAAFQQYMEKGGAWIGFHFAAFALTPSAFPQNWDWYHNLFLGSGQYKSNTWRPTSAVLRVEDKKHPLTKNLPVTSNRPPMNGIAGSMTYALILILKSCYRSTLPVFRWAPAPNNMRYGTVATIQ